MFRATAGGHNPSSDWLKALDLVDVVGEHAPDGGQD